MNFNVFLYLNFNNVWRHDVLSLDSNEWHLLQYIYPLRGYLLQLTPLGCSAPPATSLTSLVHFNSTHAQYTCTQPGHVFQDTLLPVDTLLCVGNYYHKQLARCVRCKTQQYEHVLLWRQLHCKIHFSIFLMASLQSKDLIFEKKITNLCSLIDLLT